MSTPNTGTRTELPFTITLEEPIELGSTTVHEITFRNRLSAGMMAHLPVGEKTQKMGDFYPIISKMTGETLVTVERLGYPDLSKCISVVSSFFTSGISPTGNPAS